MLSRTVADAAGCEGTWLERVRAGLVALLGFFDDEPSWARMLVFETSFSTTPTIDYLQQLHKLLADLVDSNRRADSFADCGGGSPVLVPAITGELIAGGVVSVIRTSLLEPITKLVELAPSLMAFIVMPYLGQETARAELEGRPSLATVGLARSRKRARTQEIARAAELPIRATHRTTRVLRAIAQAPYSNNREIADAAGLADEGQTSKLLARLERQGVVENVGIGAARGEPNAWLLTVSGERALALIGASGTPRPRATRVRGEA